MKHNRYTYRLVISYFRTSNDVDLVSRMGLSNMTNTATTENKTKKPCSACLKLIRPGNSLKEAQNDK